MWTFGYTEWIPEDSSDNAVIAPKHVVWGDCSTFREAISLLYGKVTELVDKASETDIKPLTAIMLDIRIIVDDPGIMDDPDQWEQDNTFELNCHKEFFVTQD